MFCLDQAVGTFGRWVEDEVSKVEGKTPEETRKLQDAKLKSLLNEKEDVRGQFADPAAFFSTPMG